MFLNTLVDMSNIKTDTEEFKYKKLGDTSGNFTLTPGAITTAHVTGNHTLTLPEITDATKQTVCVFDFTTVNAGYPSVTNTNIKKKNNMDLVYLTDATSINRLIFMSCNGVDSWEMFLEQYGEV